MFYLAILEEGWAVSRWQRDILFNARGEGDVADGEPANFVLGCWELKKLLSVMSLFALLFLMSCAGGDNPGQFGGQQKQNATLINGNGLTVQERIKTPESFTRVPVDDGSFGQYLRNLPLKPHGSRVRYYNGEIKSRDVHVAVVDIDVGERDLQQCADAVIRLRAEYLYGKGQYERIHFNFTNGFKADYVTWMQGYRIAVKGNQAKWVKAAGEWNDYASFRRYLDMVFAYAGTLSLSQEMKKVPLEEMKIGDVFLKGDDPGHCAIVVDMAENKATGEKLFMLAQSYMPAQDIHILKNPQNKEWSPWYPLAFGEELKTPEWEFNNNQLMRFED